MPYVKGAMETARKAVTNPGRFPILLYKLILRLHCGLPKEVHLIGDEYVKDEFRRHKNASPEKVALFLKEWTRYCMVLSKQLSSRGIAKGIIGINLDSSLLDHLQSEQLLQLYKLKLEAKKLKSN